MTRQINATYENRQDAERVRERLASLGVDPARIRIEDDRVAADPKNGGIFDTLAQLIAPVAAAKPRWQLSAEVEPDRLKAATGALNAGPSWAEPEGRIEPRSFVFRETRERLVIEKQSVVREEVILARDADVHVEEIRDTVRRVEVDVERRAAAPADQKGSMPK